MDVALPDIIYSAPRLYFVLLAVGLYICVGSDVSLSQYTI